MLSAKLSACTVTTALHAYATSFAAIDDKWKAHRRSFLCSEEDKARICGAGSASATASYKE
eukprot:1160015-Pelagomonas_calceolata.AAC.10